MLIKKYREVYNLIHYSQKVKPETIIYNWNFIDNINAESWQLFTSQK